MPRKQDLVGKRFGRLTVLERTNETRNGYALWRCRCDCGKEALADTRRLQRGTAASCGCISKTTARAGPIAEDLAGRRFGSLTALYRTESHMGGARWVCRCDCGKLCAVSAHSLKHGANLNCGCKSRARGRPETDLGGQRFGRLTVLTKTEKRDSNGSIFWKCRCDCGKELEATEANLVHSSCKSCGCLRRENQQMISGRLQRIDGTCIECLEYRKHRSDNTSGFRGVNQMDNGKYRVSIGFKRKKFHLGVYSGYAEAVRARMEAEEQIHTGFVKAYYAWKAKEETDPDWAKANPLVYEVKKENSAFKIITNMSMEERKTK